MSKYNLFEYNDNYSMTSGSLPNYCWDEANDDADENNDAGNYKINNNKTTTCKSFKYKTKITRRTPDNNCRLETEVVAPLQYLSKFWGSLNLPLINCKTELVWHGQKSL